MKHRYICDFMKALLALLAILVFSGLVCICATKGNYISMIVFALLDILYVYLLIRNMSIIYIDEEKIEKKIFTYVEISYTWDELEEVGLINKRYLYFSKQRMNDDERYRMWFKWPPKDKIYFLSGRKSTQYIEQIWNYHGKCFVSYEAKRFK